MWKARSAAEEGALRVAPLARQSDPRVSHALATSPLLAPSSTVKLRSSLIFFLQHTSPDCIMDPVRQVLQAYLNLSPQQLDQFHELQRVLGSLPSASHAAFARPNSFAPPQISTAVRQTAEYGTQPAATSASPSNAASYHGLPTPNHQDTTRRASNTGGHVSDPISAPKTDHVSSSPRRMKVESAPDRESFFSASRTQSATSPRMPSASPKVRLPQPPLSKPVQKPVFGGFGLLPQQQAEMHHPQASSSTSVRGPVFGGFGLPPQQQAEVRLPQASSSTSVQNIVFGGFSSPPQQQAEPFSSSNPFAQPIQMPQKITQPLRAASVQPDASSSRGFNFGNSAPSSSFMRTPGQPSSLQRPASMQPPPSSASNISFGSKKPLVSGTLSGSTAKPDTETTTPGQFSFLTGTAVTNAAQQPTAAEQQAATPRTAPTESPSLFTPGPFTASTNTGHSTPSFSFGTQQFSSVPPDLPRSRLFDGQRGRGGSFRGGPFGQQRGGKAARAGITKRGG